MNHSVTDVGLDSERPITSTSTITTATHRQTPNAVLPALIIFAFAALHLHFALKFPLAPDETYYWEWSRRPAWGYYDQGPMIAWWIRAGCIVFGETQLGIRVPIILASALTQVFIFLLAKELAGFRIAIVALLLSGITPMALAGGFIATYDPLVAMFWGAGLFFAFQAVTYGSRTAWFAFGICFGLGMLTKHTMALLAPCLGLFFLHHAHRRWLRRPEPYLALAVGISVYLPNLMWQAQHEWITFGHLFNLTGKGTDHAFPRRFGDFVGSQVGLITPLLFLGFIAALVWALRTRHEEEGDRRWFLFCVSAPVLALFILMTVKSKVQANWAVTGWVAPPVLFAMWLSQGGIRARRFTCAAAALCGILSLLMIVPESRALVGIRIPKGWDQMNKLYGGRILGTYLQAEREWMEHETGRLVKVGSTTYDATSRISFYVTGQPEACNLFLGTRPNSYLLWEEAECPLPGDNMILSDDHAPGEPGRPPFEAVFERVVPPKGGIPVWRGGVYYGPVHTYYLYRCYNYRPNPSVERPSGTTP